MVITSKKIKDLVNKGYRQAAFSRKRNAITFARAWQKKGHKVEAIRSSGSTLEGTYRQKAYYVMALNKPKRKTRRKRM